MPNDNDNDNDEDYWDNGLMYMIISVYICTFVYFHIYNVY